VQASRIFNEENTKTKINHSDSDVLAVHALGHQQVGI
jgi:hypothetical protein